MTRSNDRILQKEGPAFLPDRPAGRRNTRQQPARKPAETASTSRKRRTGKPSTPVITEAEREIIATMHLQHRTNVEIATELGCTEGTIRHHLKHHIKPVWHARHGAQLSQELARVNLLERIGWERFYVSLEPETRTQAKFLVAKAGADPQLIEEAITKIQTTGNSTWVDLIKWCIDWRCRIFGSYAPTKIHRQIDNELRVAGKTPSEVDREMLQRLQEKLEERRRYDEMMGQGGAN